MEGPIEYLKNHPVAVGGLLAILGLATGHRWLVYGGAAYGVGGALWIKLRPTPVGQQKPAVVLEFAHGGAVNPFAAVGSRYDLSGGRLK